MGDSMSKTEKIKKRKRKLLGRIGIYALGAVVLGVIIWVLYYYIRFLSYDKYKEYLSDYEYEEGGEYSAISEKDPGFRVWSLWQKTITLSYTLTPRQP